MADDVELIGWPSVNADYNLLLGRGPSPRLASIRTRLTASLFYYGGVLVQTGQAFSGHFLNGGPYPG